MVLQIVSRFCLGDFDFWGGHFLWRGILHIFREWGFLSIYFFPDLGARVFHYGERFGCHAFDGGGNCLVVS